MVESTAALADLAAQQGLSLGVLCWRGGSYVGMAKHAPVLHLFPILKDPFVEEVPD